MGRYPVGTPIKFGFDLYILIRCFVSFISISFLHPAARSAERFFCVDAFHGNYSIGGEGTFAHGCLKRPDLRGADHTPLIISEFWRFAR